MTSQEHPIIFSGQMVRAILERRKSVTRRVVKPQPECPDHGTDCSDLSMEQMNDGTWTDGWNGYVRCPYGQPGDVLWVRETWGTVRMRELGQFVYGDGPIPDRTAVTYRAGRLVRHSGDLPLGTDFNQWPTRWNDDYSPDSGRWRPSIHMPKWACRLRLRVEGVRVERLQEISEEDAAAEGFPGWQRECWGGFRRGSDGVRAHVQVFNRDAAAELENPEKEGDVAMPGRHRFRVAWDEINGKRAPWSSNPWVWVVRFSEVERD